MPALGGGRGGGGGGRGAGGGGNNFTAGTGDYSVILTIGSQTMRQRLRVESLIGIDPSAPFAPATSEGEDRETSGASGRSK
jgi:hypothetical protein